MSSDAPILIECEGSGCPAHCVRFGYGLCSMCGHPVAVDDRGAIGHDRQDIIAMLNRGDFDG
jgi:hypothetical protein